MYKEPQGLDVGHLFSSFTDVSWGSLSWMVSDFLFEGVRERPKGAANFLVKE